MAIPGRLPPNGSGPAGRPIRCGSSRARCRTARPSCAVADARVSAHGADSGVRRRDLPRSRREIRVEQSPRVFHDAVQLDDQPLPRLLPCLRLLLRPEVAHLLGLRPGARLRFPGGGEGQCGGGAAQRIGQTRLGTASRGARHEYRSLPTRGRALRLDAWNHLRAGGLRHSTVDPDQRHPAGPGHPGAQSRIAADTHRHGHFAGADR